MVVAESGTGGLVKVEGRLNEADILIGNVVQSAHDLKLDRRFTFKQDIDPKHTAKTMQEWFRDNSVNVLEWPS